MKVTCINNDGKSELLTIDKEYDSISELNDYYLILCDKGFNWWFPKDIFITKQKIRNQKLEELGI